MRHIQLCCSLFQVLYFWMYLLKDNNQKDIDGSWPNKKVNKIAIKVEMVDKRTKLGPQNNFNFNIELSFKLNLGIKRAKIKLRWVGCGENKSYENVAHIVSECTKKLFFSKIPPNPCRGVHIKIKPISLTTHQWQR